MKIATYNVNGINGRLDVLLRWLHEAQPDVVVLQELKAPDAKFPAKAIEIAGYGAVGLEEWPRHRSTQVDVVRLVVVQAPGLPPLADRPGH